MNLKLIDRKTESSDVESFVFEADQPVDWIAGQYLRYTLPHNQPDDRGQQRWFTIASAPYEKHIMLTTRFDLEAGSSFKRSLKMMKIGDHIQADALGGNFVYDLSDTKHVLIAGGIGITPYRAMLKQLNHDQSVMNVDLLYASHSTALVFETELRQLSLEQPNFQIVKYIGEQRITDNDLAHYVQARAVFYISGPKKMVDNYQNLLQQLGINDELIRLDYFPGYGNTIA